MINARSTLKHLDIDTNSPLRAVQKVREIVEVYDSVRKTNELIEQITGVMPKYTDPITALYVAQSIVETAVRQEMFDPEEAIMHAEFRANKVKTDPLMQYAYVQPTVSIISEDGVLQLDDIKRVDGTIKKGGKQLLANDLFKKHVVDNKMSNQDFIKLLMKEADMTKAGACTYAYNAGKFFNHKTDTSTKVSGKSKQELATELYRKYVVTEGYTKEQFIELAVTTLNTSKLGAQTYFYASKKIVG